MRSRLLFGAIALSLIFGSQTLMGKKSALPSKLSVRQQVDSEVDNLRKNLKIAKVPKEREKFFEKIFSNIKTLRSGNSRQFEGDEIYMDNLVSSLQEIPLGDKFKVDQCPHYKNLIVANYNPQQESEPTEAVTQTLNVLKILCENKK